MLRKGQYFQPTGKPLSPAAMFYHLVAQIISNPRLLKFASLMRQNPP
ncbi:protein of unknown function [Xenorhabdus nematophila AN6/1]|nr:protein of unknown function [Xenorhabdus nematophila AN6/1]